MVRKKGRTSSSKNITIIRKDIKNDVDVNSISKRPQKYLSSIVRKKVGLLPLKTLQLLEKIFIYLNR